MKFNQEKQEIETKYMSFKRLFIAIPFRYSAEQTIRIRLKKQQQRNT